MAFKMAAAVAVFAVLVTLMPAASFGDAKDRELVDLIDQLRSKLAKTQQNDKREVQYLSDAQSKKEPRTTDKWVGAQPRPVDPSQNLQQGLTDGQKKRVLYLLNKHRAAAGASNMNMLVWDDNLAAIGQEWSDRCIFEHRDLSSPDGKGYVDPASVGFPTTTIGENIWAFSDNSQVVPDAAVEAWDEEKNYYDFATATCQPGKDCGHYIANMWAYTQAVGCGFTKCASVQAPGGASWPGGVMLSCNFAGGADMDKQPFELGPACTECSSGQLFCTNDLCDSSCTSAGDGGACQCNANCQQGSLQSSSCSCECNPGHMGGQCDDTCRNLAPECDGDWAFTDCDLDLLSAFGVSFMYEKMLRSCPLLCHRCVESSRKAIRNHGRHQNRDSSSEEEEPAVTEVPAVTDQPLVTEAPPPTDTAVQGQASADPLAPTVRKFLHQYYRSHQKAAPPTHFGHQASRKSGRHQNRDSSSEEEEPAVTEVPAVTDQPLVAEAPPPTDTAGQGQAPADTLAAAVRNFLEGYRRRHQNRDSSEEEEPAVTEVPVVTDQPLVTEAPPPTDTAGQGQASADTLAAAVRNFLSGHHRRRHQARGD